MRALPQAVRDLVLGVFAVAVVAGAVVVLTEDPPVSQANLVATGPSPVAPSPVATETPSPSAAPTATASPGLETLVVVGPDLSRLQQALAVATGASVVVAEDGGASRVIADGGLAAVRFVPSAVVVQVVAGSRTSLRTTEAIAAVRGVWPEARLVIVGPFSAADRKSAAAVKSAAAAAGVTFLDPVALGWRTTQDSASLEEGDLEVVAARLAAALR